MKIKFIQFSLPYFFIKKSPKTEIKKNNVILKYKNTFLNFPIEFKSFRLFSLLKFPDGFF